MSGTTTPRFWAVVPAAGAGRRMGQSIPKQYLSLLKQPVLLHTLQRLAQHPRIDGIVVAITSGDPYWPGVAANPFRIPVHTVDGGAERCHSVLNALNFLLTLTTEDDWVLVHDAARPCLLPQDLDKLIHELETDSIGGLLAVPVRDTMKRADEHTRVSATIERKDLWHALTPQMFHLRDLQRALSAALKKGHLVTDEAMAMEMVGLQPRLIESSASNIKITRWEDLALAEFYLAQQKKIQGTPS